MLVTALFEEGLEEGGGFALQDPAVAGVGVVKAGVGGEVVEGTGGAGFGVGGGVDQAAYAGGVESAGAHGAGLEGGVEGTTGEAPAPRAGGGAAEGKELGVGGRVLRGLAFVVGGCQDLPSPDDHGADGDLAPRVGLFGLFEGATHEPPVPVGFGIWLFGITVGS